MNKWGMGRPKPKEKLGITVHVVPVYDTDFSIVRWRAYTIYNAKHFVYEAQDKKYAVEQVETKIRAQIAFDNLKEEVVEI